MTTTTQATYDALQAARTAVDEARNAHDTLIAQFSSATPEQIAAAFRAFLAAEARADAAFDAHKDAMDEEAEREHLAGQQARTDAATTAWDRGELSATEAHTISARITELRDDADECGPWDERIAREALLMAVTEGEWDDVAALAILIQRRTL